MKTIVGLTLNYRDAARTTRCVQSLLDNGANAVLVWDNSEDNGVSATALDQHWADTKQVHIESSPCNLGFSAGVNRGIEAILARYPAAWIMLLNNDATLRAEALSRLRQCLENPQVVIAYPRIDQVGHTTGTVFYQRHLALLRFDRPLPGSFPSPSGCALMIAPERIELPLFDEDFFMYGEDVMLGWRLGSQRMAHIPQVLVDHEGSASSGVGSEFYETRLVAGHWLLARKLARNPFDRAMLTIGRGLSLPARALVRSLRYRSLLPFHALWQGWRLAHGADPALQRARKASTALSRG
ncbi:MAG: glycosyltransferase [Thiomonas sp.]|uniref:glycosyltransferase n=1 Tax=Thiomonas sp. TaxID=2047785 RepID=UPI002A35B5B8|nr:glycosyltransferase [Thiomonas sp.]MDY0330917.1 glycosyltransferase [Thiomonas sp.]